MSLVESIPVHLKYKGNVTFGVPLVQVWNDLISAATKQVDVVSFYWTLTGEDINVNTSSDIPVSFQLKCLNNSVGLNVFEKLHCRLQGKDLLKRLEELPGRNVSVRLVSSVPTVKTNSTDFKILKQKGLRAALPVRTPASVWFAVTRFCCCFVCRSSGEESGLWSPDSWGPPQQVLDCRQKACVYWKRQHGLEGSDTSKVLVRKICNETLG